MLRWKNRVRSDLESKSPRSTGVPISKTRYEHAVPGGQFEDYSGRGPSVVVQNASGEKRVLEGAKNMKEARVRAVAIENDYKTLGTAKWCERYGVPVSFLVG